MSDKGLVLTVTTILLADDHTVVAEALTALLGERFHVLGTVNDGRSLIEAAAQLRPDVFLVDISMPGLNGMDAIGKILASQPQARILVLTMHSDAHLVRHAIRLGARGYVLKSATAEELMRAIEEVSQGSRYLSPSIAKHFTDFAVSDATAAELVLTARQREVLQLLAEGKTMKQIAMLLGISPRTVESHKYEMMEVLGVTTSAELVQYAVRMKMVGSSVDA